MKAWVNDNDIGFLPTKYTITLYNLLETQTYLDEFNRVLDNLNKLFDTDIVKSIQGETSFIDLFKATYNQEEINGETIPIWFIRLNSRAIKCYNEYYQKVQGYYHELELYDGDVTNRTLNEDITQKGDNSYTNHNVNFELPNKVTEKEYPSTKQNADGTYNETSKNNRIYNEKITKANPIEQRKLIMTSLKNVMQEAVDYFRAVFLYIY